MKVNGKSLENIPLSEAQEILWNAEQDSQVSVHYSCIYIYAHRCSKPFSIGQKPCSNSKPNVQIRKFTCSLNMGFGQRHWSECDMTSCVL